MTYSWIGAVALASVLGIVLAVNVILAILDLEVAGWMPVVSFTLLWLAVSGFAAGIWLNIVLDLDIPYAAGPRFILLPIYMLLFRVMFGMVADMAGATTSWGDLRG